ncbi:MAG TPA: FAD/NAD(P)-binding protein [Candidatus Brachybacterium merdigallinarum]|nr:FAD/NAD(P)-binding protein [Candidatus Brachybacterium merdigallinarum]
MSAAHDPDPSAAHGEAPRPTRVVLVGGGPRAVSVVERLVARATRQGEMPAPLEIDLVDPYPAGAGQVWRRAQSPQFLNNTSALRNTLFTDEEVPMSGPVAPGPSVAQWAERIAPGLPLMADPWMGPEVRAFRPWHKPSRRLQGEYFRWVLDQAVAAAPPGLRVREHRGRVLDVRGDAHSPQEVTVLGDDEPWTLHADVVVSAQGFVPDALPSGRSPRELPERLAADLDLETLPADEPVIVSALGATFFDLIGELFEGRGGRYEERPDGTLTYMPSGREPVLIAGSRTGLPRRSQRRNDADQYRVPDVPLFDEETTRELLRRHGGCADLDLETELWPVFLEQAGRLFDDRARALDLPDRFAWEAIVDPTIARDVTDRERWDEFLDGYLEREALSASRPDESPWCGVHGLTARLRALSERLSIAGALTDDSVHRFLPRVLMPAAGVLASGPPAFRVAQFAALRRAGLVRLIGPEIRVVPEGDGFRAWSPRVAGSTVRARHHVHAYQRWGDVLATADPLIGAWLERGEAVPDLIDAPDGGPATVNRRSLAVTLPDLHPITADGTAHTRRVVVGALAGQRQPGAGQAPIPHAGGTFLAGTDRAAALAWSIVEARAAQTLPPDEADLESPIVV